MVKLNKIKVNLIKEEIDGLLLGKEVSIYDDETTRVILTYDTNKDQDGEVIN